jgi:hypothetical protein
LEVRNSSQECCDNALGRGLGEEKEEGNQKNTVIFIRF